MANRAGSARALWPLRLTAAALGLALLMAPARVGAQSADIVGVITELKRGSGTIEVRPREATDWRLAAPLLALRPGDVIRVTGDASAVVLLSGGRGSATIQAASSPFVVPTSPSGGGVLQKGAALVQSSLGSRALRPTPRAPGRRWRRSGGVGESVVVADVGLDVLPARRSKGSHRRG